jgi:tetratricopeptide (TPR) repeat protein
MFELKRLHKDALPAALAKAERYRLLNEPREAESICRDVLAVDPDNDAARVLLILALTDQFTRQLGATWSEAEGCVDALRDAYARAYYRGILHERRAKARLRAHLPRSRQGAYEDFRQAMECFDEAAAVAPPGEDAAILRWNTCARMLNADPSLRPDGDADEPTMLE